MYYILSHQLNHMYKYFQEVSRLFKNWMLALVRLFYKTGMLEWREKIDSKFKADAGFLRNKNSGTAAVLRAMINIKTKPQALDITLTVLWNERQKYVCHIKFSGTRGMAF